MITNGHRSRFGGSLVLGLIWTSAAVGGDPLFPGGQNTAAAAGRWWFTGPVMKRDFMITNCKALDMRRVGF